MAAVQPEPWLRALITNNSNLSAELWGATFFPSLMLKFSLAIRTSETSLVFD
jgi:hypothetical protein